MGTFVLFNTLIFYTYYAFFRCVPAVRCAERGVLAGCCWLAHVVLVSELLGTIGWLRKPAIIIVSLAILAIFWALIVRARSFSRRTEQSLFLAALLASPVNILFAVILAGALALILCCTMAFPPRVVDELTYHLPRAYMYVQAGGFVNFPKDSFLPFFYPFNAELLFVWTVLLSGSTRWVEIGQLLVGCWGGGVFYMMAREQGMKRADAGMFP
ncbi:MAG: hypothetical protein HQL22_00430 [Candidatus Omnitrophica bacterium]|nr:hypothetical protein [Candidatus Omnitrophota bacterium]